MTQSISIAERVPVERPSSENNPDEAAWRLQAGSEACETVILAPSSDDCFFFALPLPATIDGRDRSAIQYELEHHLPIDAESMVMDYSIGKSDGQSVAYAIAMAWKPWRSIVDEIESRGKRVLAIVPQTILICRAIVNKGGDGRSKTVVVVHEDAMDWLRIDPQGVRRWKRISRDETSVNLHRATQGDEGDPLVLVGRSAEVAAWLSGLGYQVETHPKPASELALAGASLYERQPVNGWPNLLRDDLAPSDTLREIRGSLRLAVMAATLLLMCVVLGSWWRGNRADAKITSIRDHQKAAFQSTFPKARVPAALLRRIRSEHTKMKGSRGATTGVDLPIPAPNVLGDLLAGIPADLRFQMDRIDIVNGKFDLELIVASPIDAGKFADALASSGFQVDPPVTELKDSQSFDCRISGRWNPDSARNEVTP